MLSSLIACLRLLISISLFWICPFNSSSLPRKIYRLTIFSFCLLFSFSFSERLCLKSLKFSSIVAILLLRLLMVFEYSSFLMTNTFKPSLSFYSSAIFLVHSSILNRPTSTLNSLFSVSYWSFRFPLSVTCFCVLRFAWLLFPYLGAPWDCWNFGWAVR